MSQVKKYQGGGTAPTQSLYSFKVNGNEYKTDEQSMRDKFNGFFTDLVQKGEAHEKDRDKWVNSYNRILGNVKGGSYELTSSGGHLYQGKYDGSAPNEDLGLNGDGSTARKSGVGNFIGRANKSDAQRVSMLNHYFGNSIIGGYNDKQQADAKTASDAAAKAKADADTLAESTKKSALENYSNNLRGFGASQFGENYNTPEGRAMVLGDQYWNKDVSDNQRYNMLLNHHASVFKSLYSTDNDKYLDPDKLNKIKQLRQTGLQYFDPTTGQFKVKLDPHNLKSFEPLTNVLGTGAEDNPFMDKGVYDKMITGQGAPVDPNAPKSLTQVGKLWTDGSQFWKDKDKKELQTDFAEDGKLYDGGGKPLTGWYGKYGPSNNLTGWYANGTKGTVNDGKNYMNALSKNPANAAKFADLQSQFGSITDAYDKVLGNSAWNDAGKIQQDDASYNIWGRYMKNDMLPTKVEDITDSFKNLPSAAKPNIQQYVSQKLNDYNRNKIYHLVTLPDNRQFKGTIQTDAMGNVTGMNDEAGTPIRDPGLLHSLSGANYDSKTPNTHSTNTFYSGKTGGADQDARSQVATEQGANNFYTNPVTMDEGGVLKAQLGGTITDTVNNNVQKSVAPINKEANVGDIARSYSDPKYHLSGADKAELTSLAMNIGALGFSFTGAGSEIAAGLGAGSSLTQFGADTAREGFKWGNLGQLGLNLGLDAASAIPGVGVWADGNKIVKSLAKSARYLVPAMTGLGMVKAAGTLYDVVSGKKAITDLSMDDLRDLANGIHGAIGGARYMTNQLGTTRAITNSINLADGTPLKIGDADALMIKNAEDPVAAAKAVVGRLQNKPVDQVQLATKWSPNVSFTLNPKKFLSGITKTSESASVMTGKGAVIPKDPSTVTGTGPLSWLTRKAIPVVQSRLATPGQYIVDPKYKITGDGDIDQSFPGLQKGSNWGMFGDRPLKTGSVVAGADKAEGVDLGSAMGIRRENPHTGSPAQPTYEYEAGKTATVGDIPDTRRIYGTMFGMNKLDNERTVSFQQVRNRLQGLQGTQSSRTQLKSFLEQNFDEGTFSKSIQDQIKQAVSDPTSKGYVKFKEGGRIPKHQYGRGINPMSYVKNDDGSDYTSSSNGSLDNTYKGRSWGFGTLDTTSGMPGIGTYSGNVNSSQSDIGDTAPGTGFHLPKFNINPVMMSEFGRAIASSSINKMYDTRVERPMVSAPLEIGPSVHGNLFMQATANKQADDAVRGVESFKTSDSTLQTLGNLEAQRSAAGIRMQGAAASNQTLEQTRQAALNSAIQNAQARMTAANQNTETNARATQAERQQENLKRTMVTQPLLDFWQDANYKANVQYTQGRAIDTQIGGISEEQKVRPALQQLMLKANSIWYDNTIPEDQRMSRYYQYQNAITTLQNRLQQKELQLRKDPYSTQPGDLNNYYLQGLSLDKLLGPSSSTVPSNKEGGSSGAWRIQAAQIRATGDINKQTAKENADQISQGVNDETKKSLSAMKEISDLIKMALK